MVGGKGLKCNVLEMGSVHVSSSVPRETESFSSDDRKEEDGGVRDKILPYTTSSGP